MKKPFNMFLLCFLIMFLCPNVTFSSSEIIAKRGMNEEIVGQVQSMLWEMKLYDGTIDNDFGSLTEQAVKNFQRKINKHQDGIVTKELEEALAKESKLNFSKFQHQFLNQQQLLNTYIYYHYNNHIGYIYNSDNSLPYFSPI